MSGYGRERGRNRGHGDRGHGRGSDFGFGPGFGPGRGGFPFGGFPGFPGFPGPGYRRGPRARRGDVRTAILALLAEEPRNGYQIIQELAERSGGVWRPSPGSVYPALQQLEDEGLVRLEEQDGRKLYRLTDAGREHVASRAGEHAAPWDTVAGSVRDDMFELRDLFTQVAVAFWQVAHSGSAAQVAEAKRVLADSRRALYGILAEGDDPAAGEDADPEPDEGTVGEV
jgi:DNA-binding PadR family transcriptional regulator